MRSGRLTCSDLGLVLMVAFAAFERMLAVRLRDPGVGPERVDALSALTLTWFGLPADEAKRLADSPLPPWPDPVLSSLTRRVHPPPPSSAGS